MREYEPSPLGAPALPRRSSWLTPLAGALLLAAVYASVDRAALRARLAHLRWDYVCLGAAIVLPQLLCLAARWRSVAACLGVHMSLREATREYALSVSINQLLPLGVAGDALRVWRKAQGLGPRERALSVVFHTVVVERSIGQGVVLAWAVAAAPLWLGARASWLALGLVCCVWAALAALRAWPHRAGVLPRGRPIWQHVERLVAAFALVARSGRVLSTQLVLSSVILLGIVAQLYCALGALDLALPLSAAVKVFPYMLLSMALPLSVAGFGPREAVTASLYRAAHLAGSDGLAFGVAYGAMLLVAMPPCLCVALWLARAPREP